MLDYYCHDYDGYSMQQDDYNFMQMQDDYHHSPHAGIPISTKPPPPPQYSKPNKVMWSGNYSTHQGGFPGKNNYSNACYGQAMHQGYSGTDGYYIMSHAAMGGKQPYHHTMSASQFTHGAGGGGGDGDGGGDGGDGGYNSIIASSSSYPYDYNYSNKIGRPNMMQDAFMDYDRKNWGNTSTGYHYNNGQIVNCINNQIINGMPYGYNKKDDQWRRKNLA